MKLNYDPQVDALSIRFNNKPYFASDEVRDGVIFDYDKNDKIIAIEILDASKVLAEKRPDKLERMFPANLPIRTSARV